MFPKYFLVSAWAALAAAQATAVTDSRPPLETSSTRAAHPYLPKIPDNLADLNLTEFMNQEVGDFDPTQQVNLLDVPDGRLVGQHFLISRKFYMKIRNVEQARLVKSYYRDHIEEDQARYEHALAAKSEDAELLETLREAGLEESDDDDEDEHGLTSNGTSTSTLSRRGEINKKPHLPAHRGAAIPILQKALKQTKAKKHRQKAAKGRKKAFKKKKATKALQMLQHRAMRVKKIAEIQAKAMKVKEQADKIGADQKAKQQAAKKKVYDLMVQYYKYKYIKQYANKLIAKYNSCPQYFGKCCATWEHMGVSVCDGPLAAGRLGVRIPGHDCGESTFGPGISSGASSFILKDKNGKLICPKYDSTGRPYHVQILKPFGPKWGYLKPSKPSKRSVLADEIDHGYDIDVGANFDRGVPPVEDWDWGNDGIDSDDDDNADGADAAVDKGKIG